MSTLWCCEEKAGEKMKELWYTIFVLLLLGILAGVSNLRPTAAVVLNLPPTWDLSTTDFSTTGPFELDLSRAFFDPDGDALTFTVRPPAGATATIEGNKVRIENSGTFTLLASDGRLITAQDISVTISYN